jgi:hypothetical protein
MSLRKNISRWCTKIAHAIFTLGHNVNTQLHQATKYGRTEIALALIEKGADVNATYVGPTGQFGDKPLHHATKYGRTEIALALIENGADVNAENTDGEKPLHQAAKYGRTEIALALIENGANVNGTNEVGFPPLQYATVNGINACTSNVKAIKALIGIGYDLQAKLGYKTLLEHAIAADNLNVAKYIIARTKPNFTDINMPKADNNTTTFLKLATSEHDTSAASALTVDGSTTQCQLTNPIQNSKIDFAKALFGMPTTYKAKTMLKFMMFNLTFKVKDSYRIAIDLSRILATKKPGGKHVPCDALQLIMQFAGLSPGNIDLSKIDPKNSQEIIKTQPPSLFVSENISSSSSSCSKNQITPRRQG